MTEIALENCCESPTGPGYNPKEGTGRRVRDVWFSEPPPPIPAQVEDAGELRAFFAAFRDRLVPYSGTEHYTSHALQAFLIALGDLSPTKAAVIGSQKKHAFGGRLEIVQSHDPEWDLGETGEVSEAEKRRFYDFARMVKIHGVDEQPLSFRQLAGLQFGDWKKSGDYFFEMVRTQTLGVRSFRVHVHRPTHCLYRATDTGQQRWVVISPVWTADFLTRFPPRILPVYPTWVEDETGAQRTLVHVKNGDGAWYGRPEDVASMLDQFLEFQNSDYKNKQTASAFIGQAFIEIEDANPEYSIGDGSAAEDSFDSLADQFEQNYTNRSRRPQRVILSSRPFDSSPAYVFQFSPNTDSNWFKVSEEIAERNIIKANGWSKRLLDIDTANGFSTNVYLDMFEIYSATSIQDYQRLIEAPINNVILREAAMWYGQDEMMQYSIEFTSPFHRMLKERKEAMGGTGSGEQGDNGNAGANPMDAVSAKIEAYGAGVRAGLITPQAEDEAAVRTEMGLPGVGPDIQKAWKEDEGFRRPVTLKLKQEVQKIEESLDDPKTPEE